MGLAEMYRETGERRFLEGAQRIGDGRGHKRKPGGAFCQALGVLRTGLFRKSAEGDWLVCPEARSAKWTDVPVPFGETSGHAAHPPAPIFMPLLWTRQGSYKRLFRKSAEGARRASPFRPFSEERNAGAPALLFERFAMLEVHTRDFGLLRCEESAVVRFPQGIPAFEDERDFVVVEPPEVSPAVVLQSLARPEVAFVALPVGVIEAEYQLQLSPEDLAVIGLGPGEAPVAGREVLCLAIVTLAEQPTANLLAPVVINPRNRRGVQAIQSGAGYSHQSPLALGGKDRRC